MAPTRADIAFDSESFLKNLTKQPGVYQMYDQAGDILYVGKAKNLKNRVSSYFRSSGLNAKTQALVKRIHSIEITVAPSEAEALVLEHNLIKSQKPPFNIMLRDDKSFPYIFMSEGEDYPRLAFHRGAKRKKGKYFGPFPNAGAVRDSLNFLQKTFGVRQCEDSVYQNRTRPCLLYQINRCSGPCVEKISQEDYHNDLENTRLFLEGKSEQLHQRLVQKMEKASDNLNFEKAAVYRDQITALRQVQAQQVIEAGGGNMDVITAYTEAGLSCIHLLYVRHGRIIGSKSYFPKDKLSSSESEVLSAFVAHHYLGHSAMDTPPSIVLGHDLEDRTSLEEAISTSLERPVKITSNVRTYKAKWLAMANEAARQNLKNLLNNRQTLLDRFESLQDALDLDDMPGRIECFDISHSSGENTVASCVVFDINGAVKSDYRRFNIEGITGGDDYAAMKQAITRRYTRLQKEAKPLPDVLFIDGGRGQLNMAKSVLDELGIANIATVGIAKGVTRKPGMETLIFTDGQEKHLEGDHSGLHLIQQIRDEAHRFAITGHKQQRDRKRKTSTLEQIPGIGAKRRRELLKHFGGLQEVMKANADDLTKVNGISKKMAMDIYSALHSE